MNKMDFRDITVNNLSSPSVTDSYRMFFYTDGYCMKNSGEGIIDMTDLLSTYDIHFEDLNDEDTVRNIRSHFDEIQRQVGRDIPIVIQCPNQGYCTILSFDSSPTGVFPDDHSIISINPGSLIYRKYNDTYGYISYMRNFSTAMRIPMENNIPKSFYDHYGSTDITSKSYESLNQTVIQFDNKNTFHVRSPSTRFLKGPIIISILPDNENRRMKIVPYVSSDRLGMTVLSGRCIEFPLTGSYTDITRVLDKYIQRIFHTVYTSNTDIDIFCHI